MGIAFFFAGSGRSGPGGGPRKLLRQAPRCQASRRSIPRGRAPWWVTAAVATLTVAACATPGPVPRSVTRTRRDGREVTCARPPDAWLGTDEAAGLSASFPGIVQTLLAQGDARRKVDDVVRNASTPELLTVLSYRLCLEYAKDVIPQDAYDAWMNDVRPGLERRVRRPGG